MNTAFFIVKKIAFAERQSFSAFIIRIALAAVALSVATMIVTTALVNGFQKEIRGKIFGFWSHIHIQPYSLTASLGESGVSINENFYLKKNVLKDAEHIQPYCVKGGLLKTKDAFEGIVLKGVGNDFNWKNFEHSLVKGKVIANDTATRKQILISKITADRLQLDTGERVIVHFIGKEIKARAFTVQGIYETGIEEFDREFAITNMQVIQDLNHWGKDTVSGFEVFLKDKNLFKSRSKAYFFTLFGGLMNDETAMQYRLDPIDEIAFKMNEEIANQSLEAVSIKELKPGIFDWLDLQTMNELIILTLMIIVAIINMITTLLILILERTTMIGLLKALGAMNKSIVQLFLIYAAFIIGSGIIIGNFIGLGLCFIQYHFHWITLPKESYYLSYAPIDINWIWVVAINVMTILITLLVLIIPSMLIAKISPVKALRFN